MGEETSACKDKCEELHVFMRAYPDKPCADTEGLEPGMLAFWRDPLDPNALFLLSAFK